MLTRKISHAGLPCIMEHGLPVETMERLRDIVSCAWMDSPDYKAKQSAQPFIQSYAADAPTFILIEFWGQSSAAIDEYIAYLNVRVQKED